jgi:signal transduction histidine kinase
MKTELITNVSHDIKTPLTSIINYVDLIKKEEISGETMRSYVEVLDRQSAKLKKLIEDLVEASKASSGQLAVNMSPCEIGVCWRRLPGSIRRS